MSAFAKGRLARREIRRPVSAGHGPRSSLGLAIAAILSSTVTLHVTPAGAAVDVLGEVVVTARKRAENLQDVPQSVEVFTTRDLQNLAITQFEDYASRTPSISFVSIGPGTQQFFMRGVSDGSNPNVTNTSTTGFFVDDLALSYYGSIPDLHMYDIERIEVLNGPQGTLYGAGAMSGAVRIITAKPDPNNFSAGVDFDGGRIDGGGDNRSFEGFVNIPIIDGKTAVRLSAFSVHQGGFINNVAGTRLWANGAVSTNTQWAGKNYNKDEIEGARIAIKQVLTDDWQVTLSGNYQRQKHTGAWDQDPGRYGVRNVSRFGPEYGNNYYRFLDLHLDGDVGIANLVYAGGYWSQPSRSVVEYSEYAQYVNTAPITANYVQAFACATDPIYGAGFSGCNVPTMWTDYQTQSERWSHELRLESKPGGRTHWIAGAYWEKTRQLYSDFWNYPGVNFAGQAAQYWIGVYNKLATPLPGEWYSYRSRFDYLQTTEFGDLTFDLTDRWSVEAGIEHFKSDFTSTSDWAGYFYNPKVPSVGVGSSKKTNLKAGVNFKAAENLLFYFSFAQGFRDGGFNSSSSSTNPLVPRVYKPDTLNSYELGWKSVMRDSHLLWNGALYYMKWKDYQTSVFDLAISPTAFNANIGNARIYGVESNVEYRPTERLTFDVSASYNDSRLVTNDYLNPKYVVLPGERLPYVPYFNYSASARYERPLNDRIEAYAQFDISHKGNMWSDLRATNAKGFGRVLQPAYDISNLRIGLSEPDGHWEAEAYVTNLMNKRAVVFVNTGNYDHRETTNEPPERVNGFETHLFTSLTSKWV